MHTKQAILSPRRPAHPLRLHPLAYTPSHEPDNSLKNRLEAMLNWLNIFANRTDQTNEPSQPSSPDNFFSEDGPLGLLQFWNRNKKSIDATGKQIRQTGRHLAKGDLQEVKNKASGLDFSWLTGSSDEQGGAMSDAQLESVVKKVENSIDYLLDALTPWDFDRHDFGFTFANVWDDVETGSGEDPLPGIVKLVSTIKPLEKEWKLTARSKIMDLGEGGVLFGKAGMYLVGERPAFIGVEADKVWRIPGLDTKAFLNVNYRSSRSPRADPVRSSIGIQRDFPLIAGVVLCLRMGINPLEREKVFVTPVPNGSYF